MICIFAMFPQPAQPAQLAARKSLWFTDLHADPYYLTDDRPLQQLAACHDREWQHKSWHIHRMIIGCRRQGTFDARLVQSLIVLMTINIFRTLSVE